jgi:hypothetical protein
MHLVMQYPSEVPGVGLADMLAEAFVGSWASADGLVRASLRGGRTDQLPGGAARPLAQRRPLRRREEAQRNAAARGAGEPKFAILDELDSGLDIDALRDCARRVEDATNETGLGVLAITHYNRLLEELHPDHVHILVKGRIVPVAAPSWPTSWSATATKRSPAASPKARRRRPAHSTISSRSERAEAHIARRRAMRSSVAGWVLNMRAMPLLRPPRSSLSGLWM